MPLQHAHLRDISYELSVLLEVSQWISFQHLKRLRRYHERQPDINQFKIFSF